jgi:hypothetical protein
MRELSKEQEKAVAVIVQAVTAMRSGSKPRLSDGWSVAEPHKASRGGGIGETMYVLTHNDPVVIREAQQRVGSELPPGTAPGEFLYIAKR